MQPYAPPPPVAELRDQFFAMPEDVAAGMTVDGSESVGIGWCASTGINETTDAEGSVFPGELNNGTNNGEADGSHWTAAMRSRSRDDPGVLALRDFLKENNGLRASLALRLFLRSSVRH